MRAQLKSILCTTDLSDFSNYAVPYGIALAKKFGAKLYLCHVIDLTPVTGCCEVFIDSVPQDKAAINHAQEQLNKLIGEQKVDLEKLVIVGHPVDDITRLAKEKQVDLAIAATQGRSGLKWLILGSTTECLMQRLPCPLMSIRSPKKDIVAPSKQEVRIKKILVGCDFSTDSILAFEYALSLAQKFESELHLAHVIEPPVCKNLFKRVVKPSEDLMERMRNSLVETLSKMIPEETYNWCRHKTTLLAGQPHDQLFKYALANGIDLIVLGARGHSLLETLLMGSTTDRVVRQALCPVLSVRPMLQV